MVAVLSISGSNIMNDCSEVILLMKTLGINGDVTSNKTILDGNLENGCRIYVASKNREDTPVSYTHLTLPTILLV